MFPCLVKDLGLLFAHDCELEFSPAAFSEHINKIILSDQQSFA